MYKYFLVFALLISSGVAYSDQNDDILKEISNNISDEYVTCGSFFGIVSGSLKNSKKFDLSAEYESVMDRALDQALITAEIGRTSEMAQKVTLARFKMTMNEMKELINSDYSNISILLNDHSKRCQWVMENTDDFMAEWRNKILKKHGLFQQK